MYSGGLTYLHAGAMKTLGRKLSSMRWVLLVASLVGVACWYGIASHFAPPWAAMLASLLCNLFLRVSVIRFGTTGCSEIERKLLPA